MRNDCEIRRFTVCYAALSGVFLLFLSGVCLRCTRFGFAGMAAAILCGLCFALAGYLLFRRLLARILEDVAAVSDAMVQVLEGEEDYAAEQYREGTLGILNTNFYKMVSALRESQVRTLEEKKFLQDTISDISHQLKTPLASLNVFVDLLCEDKVPEEERRRQILREARNQLGRMEWMVLSMLKLARIEAGAVKFEKAPCSAAEIAARAAESVAYLTDARGQVVRVVRRGDGRSDAEASGEDDRRNAQVTELEDVILHCDREWLTEGLINLLKNASDYSPEGTEIVIELEENRLYSRIYVRDQGMGIPEEALPHVFERFYRVNREVNPNSVGIGLSLTKSIVEGMGGRIAVRSRPGQYTCFVLTFVKTL